MFTHQQNTWTHPLGAPSPTLRRVASLNAYKHGLTAKILLIHELDRTSYVETVNIVFNEYKPATPMEQLIVQEIADTTWKLDRTNFYEAGLFAKGRLDHKNLFGPDVCSPEERHLIVESEIHRTYASSLANLNVQRVRTQRYLDRKIAQFEKLRSEREVLEVAEADTAMNSMLGDPKDTRPCDASVGPVFTAQFLASRYRFSNAAGSKKVVLFDRFWGDPRLKPSA